MIKINIITIGTKAPDWVNTGYSEYAKRLSKYCQLTLTELPVTHRSKNISLEQAKHSESTVIASKIQPQDYVIALDVMGKQYSTEDLANYLENISMNHSSIAIIIGGPDGLDYGCFKKIDHKISLSKLTLPHPMVRVLLSEQLYRAYSLINNHPYHK